MIKLNFIGKLFKKFHDALFVRNRYESFAAAFIPAAGKAAARCTIFSVSTYPTQIFRSLFSVFFLTVLLLFVCECFIFVSEI